MERTLGSEASWFNCSAAIVLALSLAFQVSGCKSKSYGDQLEDEAERIGDKWEDAAEDSADDVEDIFD